VIDHRLVQPRATGFAAALFDAPRTTHVSGRSISKSQMRCLIDANIFGVIISNSSGAIIDANDAFLTMVGETRARLRAGALDWRRLTPDEWRPYDDDAIVQMSDTGIVRPYAKEYFHTDGHRVPISLNIVPIAGGNGQKMCCTVDVSSALCSGPALGADAQTMSGDWINPRAALFAGKLRFRLTNREHEVAAALLHGKTNSEIAQALFISQTTAGDHVRNVLRKLGVNRLSEVFSLVCLGEVDPVAGRVVHERC
jgi:PAS domain S-box-containing protein